MMSTAAAATRIEALRQELTALRPLSPGVLASIRERYDYELTYTSNAIEGNTLTQRETEQVIAHGVTIGGKRISEHLEALDHHDALRWMYEVAASEQPLTAMTVRQLHEIVLARSRPDLAGQYAVTQRRIGGSDVSFPSAAEVRPLMTDLGDELGRVEMTPHNAFDAHRKLVTIHPFDDGNGRTARLLMNLMLVRGGYRPVAVRLADRLEYLDSLERSQLTGDDGPFQAFMHRRLEETMTDYLAVVHDAVQNQERFRAAGEERSSLSAAQQAYLAKLGGQGR